MTLYQIIVSIILDITCQDKQIIQQFETYFRDSVSACDMKFLSSGSIPSAVIKQIITSSLISLSSYLNDLATEKDDKKYQHYSVQIWNPMVKGLLQQVDIHDPTSSLRSTTNKVKKSSVNSSLALPAIDETLVSDIRSQLRSFISDRAPFSNKFHKHVQCKDPECKFCKTLASRVNVTKCIDHKPCHSTGFYPHVGKSLWQMIKNKHSKTECKLKPKPCSPGELPCIELVAEVSNSQQDRPSSSTSWLTLMDEESLESPRSPIVYGKPSKILKRSFPGGDDSLSE